ncbi:transmembrane amino acid transporter protein-domain-containing protein [Dipodascopsis uninucleata]
MASNYSHPPAESLLSLAELGVSQSVSQSLDGEVSFSQHDQENSQSSMKSTFPTRRGSLTASLMHAGGVNSLDRFASSYKRAQAFKAVEAPLLANSISAPVLVDAEESLPLIDVEDHISIDHSMPKSVAVVTVTTAGNSTAPQTMLNSVNVLIGIGLLALPLALSYAGWVFGCVFLVIAACVTLYTAKVLARCLDLDPNLQTYADIAYAAFGSSARLLTSILFSLELLGSCVALVVLFADALDSMTGGSIPNIILKLIAFAVLTPLSFMPLSFLSFTSFLGIVSTLSIVIVVFIDGIVKRTQPGSLWQPMETSLFPTNWMALPLSFGLLMAPWCGHSVFPNIYRDMRHPYKFSYCLNVSYSFTFVIDATMAILGFLMFGNAVSNEVTGTVLKTKGYPPVLNLVITVCIAIVPISKTPLNARPIITTIESLLGRCGQFTKFMIRVGVNAAMVFIAIIFPSFDRIMALVGSALGFTICVILPLACYLKLFIPRHGVSNKEVFLDIVLIFCSFILAILGGVWAFLPERLFA